MEIYSWSPGFDLRQKFMNKYKSSTFSSIDVCIFFGDNTRSHLRCSTYTDYTNTRGVY